MPIRVHRIPAAALLAACAVAVTPLPGSAATPPTLTVSTPTSAQVLPRADVRVQGHYLDDRGVARVDLVACLVDAAARCTDFVQRDGSLGATSEVHEGRLSDPGKVQGRFDLAFPPLPLGGYRLAATAVDVTGARGRTVTRAFTVAQHAPAGDGFISIMWSRSRWAHAAYPHCSMPAGVRTLEQDAQDLAARGLTAVMSVVIDRTAELTRTCEEQFSSYASWRDLARLRDVYGWHAVSHGRSHTKMTEFTTDAQRRAESCGSLDALRAHGHDTAWGLFNYAGNAQDDRAQAVVGTCFAFGRWYSQQRTIRAKATTPPYRLNVLSVNGGKCNNPGLPCSRKVVQNDQRYTSPELIGSVLRPTAGEYGVVQLYTLLEGRSARWDCTGPGWRDHWTYSEETYCRVDALAAIDARSRSAVDTHPAAVARAWGRLPGS